MHCCSQHYFRTPAGSDQLERLLIAFSFHVPTIGYCQGLNVLCGTLLLVSQDEIVTFALLSELVMPRMAYYTRSMAGCLVDVRGNNKYTPQLIRTSI